jgi:hypothetical protein
MKTEKFQLHGNNSACAATFQLLRGRAPAQLRGKIGIHVRKNVVYEVNFSSNACTLYRYNCLPVCLSFCLPACLRPFPLCLIEQLFDRHLATAPSTRNTSPDTCQTSHGPK